jgi:hypothetical protein
MARPWLAKSAVGLLECSGEALGGESGILAWEASNREPRSRLPVAPKRLSYALVAESEVGEFSVLLSLLGHVLLDFKVGLVVPSREVVRYVGRYRA